MAFLHRFSKSSLSLSKISGVLIATTSTAAFAVFAVPYLIAALSTAASSIGTSVRFLLVPPYLFITIHVIIVAIWKLSEQKSHRHPNGKPSDAVTEVDRSVTPLKTPSAEITVGLDAVTPISDSKSAESCVTTDSDENSAVSSGLESFEKGLDLEDTWQTIVMKKSATWERSIETAAVAADLAEKKAADLAEDKAARMSVTFKESPAVEVNDELNRMFEAFIKKNYDQIRSY